MNKITINVHRLSFLFSKYLEVEVLGHRVRFMLSFIRNCQTFLFAKWLYYYTFLLTLYETSKCSKMSPNLVFSDF